MVRWESSDTNPRNVLNLNKRSSQDPSGAGGLSLALHVFGVVVLLAISASAPRLVAPVKHVLGPLWLAPPEPAPPPQRVRILPRDAAPPPPAALYRPRAIPQVPRRAIAPSLQPAVRVETPANPLPPPPLVAAPSPPKIQTDLFAGLAVPTPVANPALPVPTGVLPGGFDSAGGGPSTARTGRVAVGGFASVEAAAPPRAMAAVRSGAFGDMVAAAPAKPRLQVASAGTTTAVEILAKPNPAYTEEARRLQIEGEVVLRITFTASGSVEVLAVVRGLGHGLDEKAIEAARRIRFRPALQHGQAVDSTAQLRMSFQLAY
jgi:TonB family protein